MYSRNYNDQMLLSKRFKILQKLMFLCLSIHDLRDIRGMGGAYWLGILLVK